MLLTSLTATLALGGKELIYGKGNALEEFTGVIAGAATGAGGAALFGQAVVIDWHQQLAVPLQADDGELTQGDEDPAAVLAGGKVTGEALAHAGGYLTQVTVAAATIATIDNLGA